MSLYQEDIRALKEKIEKITRIPHTPMDFTYISNTILEKTKEYVSPTTLMRIWGYVKDECKTRSTTLNILSRFLGYGDYNEFTSIYKRNEETEPHPFMAEFIFSSKIKIGQSIEFTWNPDRRCVVEYLGNNMFEVKSEENSKLESGDLFTCPHFIQNEPLYIFDLQSKNETIKTYEIGRKNGLTSLKLL